MNQYSLGGVIYKTKKDIESKCREISARACENTLLEGDDYNFVHDLFECHPNYEEKAGCGVAGFVVERDKLYGNGKHFCVVRTDGSKTDFSWKKCVSGKQTNKRRLVLDAMRRAVQKQIFEYADKQFEKAPEIICPITGEIVTRDNCHVDHVYPNTFSYLSQEWIDDNNLSHETIELKHNADGYGYVFADIGILHSWQSFHSQNAKLRILSPNGNISISNKGGQNEQISNLRIREAQAPISGIITG